MNRIKSISEAFSMQPVTLTVTDKPTSIFPEGSIKEIRPEVRTHRTGEKIDIYVGYNFEGKKLFEYIASSVNVHYF